MNEQQPDIGQIITRQQARELDRRAVEEYGLAGVVLMENAGRGVVDLLLRLGVSGKIVVCAGSGNNGGDGLVIARRLELLGYEVTTLVCGARRDDAGGPRLSPDAQVNFHELEKGGARILLIDEAAQAENELRGATWIVDALLGSGAVGDPRPPFSGIIEAMNAAGAPIVAVDLPSGLDCDTGAVGKPTIRAAHTCTFVAAKPGFFEPGAREYVGELHVADIGAPRKLVEEVLAARG